jgi:hypothetical protein
MSELGRLNSASLSSVYAVLMGNRIIIRTPTTECNAPKKKQPRLLVPNVVAQKEGNDDHDLPMPSY